jgi:glutamyl-tRNA reductase
MKKEIYQKAFEAARIERDRAIKKGYIPKEYEEQAYKMTQQALKRFLHQMSSKMRSVSEESKADMLTSAVQFLIEKDRSDMPDKYKCEHALNIIEGR